MKQKKIFIYGKHAVSEALRHAPQLLRTVYLSPLMKDKEILSLINRANIKTEKLDPRKATSQVEGNAPHQGIIALMSVFGLALPFEDFIKDFNPAGSLLVYLDGIQDPHNVGAIIRAAAAFGASGVLLPGHGQSPITAAVIKASAGAVFSVPLVSVTNTQQTLAELRRKGVAVYGLAGGGSSIVKEEFTKPTLFILGNESTGISPAARAVCDKMLEIPISKKVESLNVASAATAALYAWSSKNSS